MAKVTKEQIEERVKSHELDGHQVNLVENVRGAIKSLLTFINHTCPDSREKSLAMTNIEEAMFWANASISRNPHGK